MKKPTSDNIENDEAKHASQKILWGQLRSEDRNAIESDRTKFFKKIPFFQTLNRRQLQEISQILYERDYQENEYLFEVGQPGAALFIVQTGEIAVEIPNSGGLPTRLATIGKYSFVGELALLDESPRSASARCLKPSKIYAFFKTDLDRLLETEPEIAAPIYKALATIVGSRLKATNDLIDKKMRAA